MMTQELRHQTVTQNIANLNTTGYKATNSVQRSFPEVLVSMIGGNESNPSRKIGKFNTGVYAEESIALYTEGALRQTFKTTDFAWYLPSLYRIRRRANLIPSTHLADTWTTTVK
ncbi:flagellar basal-body rod protein FlgF [Paenibacillus sp. JCM 10914]|nr:flagellar basal-body rod protein FlgF [Paenibacillus sp. JCM 10914]